MVQANKSTGQRKKRFMNVFPSLIANLQSTIAIEPGQGPFHHPAMTPEALVRFDAFPCNPRNDLPLFQSLPTVPKVVSFIRVQFLRSSARTTAPLAYRWDGVDHHLQHLCIVHIGRGDFHRERDALPIHNYVAFRAGLAAIRWVRAGRAATRGRFSNPYPKPRQFSAPHHRMRATALRFASCGG